MTGRKNSATLVTSLVVALALVAGGCSSTSSSGGENLARSYSRTRGHLNASQAQVDETLSALNSMRITNPTNLSNAFSQYKKAVTDLEKKGSEAKHLAEAMKDNMDTNTMTWEKEMESIQDPAIRSSVEARRAAVKSNYDMLKMYAQDARAAYEPFLKDNQDIVKALSMNLSPAAVSGLASSMDKAAADGKTLKQKIAAMQGAMDNIANGQPATGAPAAR